MREAFGPYQVVRELGRGGIGVVYEAFDPRLDRSVAIKILRDVAAGDSRLERFRREAQAQARLAHPNVVTIYEVGVERGVPFIVMELVRGRSLREELHRRGSFPAEEALALVARIARGVEAVHSAGVIHRDLKPENVILENGVVPKVMDFGLAKDPASGADNLSRTGQLLGTPFYMSPEQVAGRKDRIGVRTDVWALGVLLHELIAGDVPFQGSELVATLARIASEPPRPLVVRGAAGRAAARIVSRALEKEPEKRYESAGELARACEEALATREGRARWPWPVATLLVGIAAGGLAGSLAGRGAPRPAPSATPPEPRTGRALLERARASRKDRAALEALARAPAADVEAALVANGLRALAGADPEALERGRTDEALDAAALGFLLAGDTGRARAAAVVGSPLGELVRRECPPPVVRELAPVATVSHPASGPRLAVAGESVVAAGPWGGPVRAYALPGTFVGLADATFGTEPRFLAGSGGWLAWTGPREAVLGYAGTRLGVPLAFDPGPIAVTPAGELVLWDRAFTGLVVMAGSKVVRTCSVRFDPGNASLSEDGRLLAYTGGERRVAVANVAATRGETLVEYPTDRRGRAVGWVRGALAVVEPGGGALVLHDPKAALDQPPGPDRARRVVVPGEGSITAIAASPEQGVFAVARGAVVHVFYDQETLEACTPPLDAGDEVASLAFARDGALLLVGRRTRAPLACNLLPLDGDVSLDDTVETLFRVARGRAPRLEEKASYVGHARDLRDKARAAREGVARTERLLRWYLRRLLVRDATSAGERGPGERTVVDERLEEIGPFEGAEETIGAAVFLDSAGTRVATGGWDGSVRASDVDGALAWDLVRDGALRGLGLGGPRRQLVEWDVGGTNLTAGMLPAEPRGGRQSLFAVSAAGPGYELGALSPLGERLVVASRERDARKVVRLLPSGGNLGIADAPAGAGPARAIAITAEGALLTALEGGGVAVEADPVKTLLAAPPLRAIASAPDGRWIAGLDAEGQVLLLEAGRTRPRRWPDVGRARALAFSPDGLSLALLLETGELTLRAFPSGDLTAHAARVAVAGDTPPLVWSDDGRRILAGSGPVSVFAVERAPAVPGETARLAQLLGEARQAEDPRRGWALARAVARGAAGGLGEDARELERRLEPRARARAWESILAIVSGPEHDAIEAEIRQLRGE